MVPWFSKSEVCCLNQLKPWIPSMHHSHFFDWAVHNFDWAYSLVWNGYILQRPLHLRKCISFCGTWPVHVIGRTIYLNSRMIFIQHVWTKYHLWHQLKLFTRLAWSHLNEVLTSAIVSHNHILCWRWGILHIWTQQSTSLSPDCVDLPG